MSVDTVNTITVTGAEDEVKKFRDAEVIPPEGQDWGRICVLEDTPEKLVYEWITKFGPVGSFALNLINYPALDIDISYEGDGQDPYVGHTRWSGGKLVGSEYWDCLSRREAEERFSLEFLSKLTDFEVYALLELESSGYAYDDLTNMQGCDLVELLKHLREEGNDGFGLDDYTPDPDERPDESCLVPEYGTDDEAVAEAEQAFALKEMELDERNNI
jgi:hypothetical protein